MNLYDVLSLKYPNADFLRDILLQDDGHGAYIAQWNLEGDKPTDAQIEQWKSDLAQDYIFKCNKLANADVYNQLDELDLKSIRALRINDTQKLAELEQQAAALRAQLLPVK